MKTTGQKAWASFIIALYALLILSSKQILTPRHVCIISSVILTHLYSTIPPISAILTLPSISPISVIHSTLLLLLTHSYTFLHNTLPHTTSRVDLLAFLSFFFSHFLLSSCFSHHSFTLILKLSSLFSHHSSFLSSHS
jgi:hypothetical protein